MKRYKIRFDDGVSIEVEGTLFFISNDYEGAVPQGNKYIYLNPKNVSYVEEIKEKVQTVSVRFL